MDKNSPNLVTRLPRHIHSTSVYLNGSAWQKQVLEVFAHSCTQSQTQGDQIGRIFAYWAIVFFGHFLKMTQWA
jgi:hypothetical protein